ncbi:helix-turn-helix domain-containing protein [Agrococcus jejuensis]|uniref:helix-turn-helix domain-containing protein n=1 Tax=Agrococcus jejuensis TaxID=399736 RepID=UPI0012FB1C64|nr:helix-turn-helix transcriptional regulator [Agrococcus jejuensis]
MSEVERVGASLRTLRESAGMSQDELATAIGVGTGHLHAIEEGRVVPSAAFLASAASALAARLLEHPLDDS